MRQTEPRILEAPSPARRRNWPWRARSLADRRSARLSGPLAELTVAFALIGLLCLVAFGAHVLDGGFYYDDWSVYADYRFPAEPGFVGLLEQSWSIKSFRPLLALYHPLEFVAFGGHFRLHIAWTLFLAVAMSASLFLFYRVLGLARIDAFALGALVLVFPFADAPRLWPTAGFLHIAVMLVVAGLLVALRGLEAPTRRSAILHHAGALALYLASLLLYEATAGLVVAAGLLYAWRASARQALLRCAADILLVAAVYVRLRSETIIPQSSSIDAMRDHARIIVDQALVLLSEAAVPVAGTARNVVLGLVLVVVAVALVAVARLPREDPARLELRRWLALAAGGAVVFTVSWAVYIPADPYYSPGTLGVGNRVNFVASIGVVAFVYALPAMAGVLLFGRLVDWRRWARGFGLTAVALIAVAYTLEVRADVREWGRAYASEQEILGALRAIVPDPEPGTTIYTFNHDIWEAPGVPVFAATWDLLSATRILYDDPTLVAYPIPPGTVFVCDAAGLYPTENGYGPTHGDRYGEVIFVDVGAGQAVTVDAATTCRTDGPRLVAKTYKPPGS